MQLWNNASTLQIRNDIKEIIYRSHGLLSTFFFFFFKFRYCMELRRIRRTKLRSPNRDIHKSLHPSSWVMLLGPRGGKKMWLNSNLCDLEVFDFSTRVVQICVFNLNITSWKDKNYLYTFSKCALLNQTMSTMEARWFHVLRFFGFLHPRFHFSFKVNLCDLNEEVDFWLHNFSFFSCKSAVLRHEFDDTLWMLCGQSVHWWVPSYENGRE